MKKRSKKPQKWSAITRKFKRRPDDLAPSDLEQAVGAALLGWADVVTKMLGPGPAWRVLLGATLAAMRQQFDDHTIAALFHELGDKVGRGDVTDDDDVGQLVN